MTQKSAPAEPEMIGVREFARRDGCDEKLVRNAVRTGHLPKSPDRRLPASLVGTGWREGNRRRADRVRTVRSPQSALRTVSAPPRLSDDSERAAGFTDGLLDMARGVLGLVSAAEVASLRFKLLARMAELLDREGVDPIVLVVDDAELARVTEADTWTGYCWADVLDEAEAALGPGQ